MKIMLICLKATGCGTVFLVAWRRMNQRSLLTQKRKLRLGFCGLWSVKWGEQERVTGGREPDMRIGMRRMRMRTHLYLSPVVGVGHVDQGIVLSQQIVPVDDVHHELVIEPVFGDYELLQVVDSDGARALEEPSVWVVRLQAVRSVAAPVVVVPVFAHIAETDGR